MEEKIIIQKRPPKSPFLAGFLSILPFGVGAMYNGLYFKGFIYLIVFSILVKAQDFLHRLQPLPAFLLVGFIFYQIIESVQTAAAINRKALTGKDEGPVQIEDQILEPVKSGSIFWGIFLIVLGTGFLLANFEIIDYDILWDLWPVAVIGIGIKLVMDFIARSKKEA